MDFVYRTGNGFDPFPFSRSQMRAGMGDEICDTQRFASLELIDERQYRTFSQITIRRT